MAHSPASRSPPRADRAATAFDPCPAALLEGAGAGPLRRWPLRPERRSHSVVEALLVRAALLCLTAGCSASSRAEQPVHYIHEIHVAQEEIPCTDCHEGAEEAEHATLPPGEVCRDCHEETLGDSPAEATLVAMLSDGGTIPWKRVHKLQEYVRFSHQRHVKAGGVLCETCHGAVAERVEPFSRPYIDFNGPSGMERCISCHLESGNPRAGIDCALCHR